MSAGIVSHYLLKTTKDRFSVAEDSKLLKLVDKFTKAGKSDKIDWSRIAKIMKNKTARQCRERWNNYLNPNLKQGEWTPEEDRLLLLKYNEIGTHWNVLAKSFEGRSGNNVRNRFLTLKRRSQKKAVTLLHEEEQISPNDVAPTSPGLSDVMESSSENEGSKRQPLSPFQIGNIIDQIFKIDFTDDLFGNDFNFF